MVPFARDAARIRRDHPSDNGETMDADTELVDAVAALLDTRAARKRYEETEDRLETAIKARMGDFAQLTGPGWHITWKRTKDREEPDWKALATGLLTTLPESRARCARRAAHDGQTRL